MGDFKVTVLGNGSAVPTSWHKPSSQLVFYNGRQFLIDCGEGTQMQMVNFKMKRRNIDHIFISHLHGDHYYGLIGLINTFHLMRREEPLHIFAPAGLEAILDLQLKVSSTKLFYPVEFHALEDFNTGYLYENEEVYIRSFPLKHSIKVWGFLIKEKEKKRKLSKDFVKQYSPSIAEINKILFGGDFITSDGKLLSNSDITLPANPSRSYAYCSDTAYQESTVEAVKGVDLLYHESTFDNSQTGLAKKTLHSTAAQAASVAKKAGAAKLLLGHYSARFKDLNALLEEAREVFPESFLSEEGETYYI